MLALRIACRILADLLLVYLGVNVFFLLWEAWLKHRRRPSRFRLLLVLGARLRPDGAPDVILRQRLEVALALYREGAAPMLLLSGGQIREPRPEAEAMREFLMQNGVPESALLLETKSRNTWENFRFCAPLLQKYAAREILLVTSEFHGPRAGYLARKHGPGALSCALSHTVPASLRILNRHREYLGWAKYFQIEIRKHLHPKK